jgi:hypothetical protein
MELGDSTAAEREQRSVVEEALDRFDSALTDVINTVETGGFDRLAGTLLRRRSSCSPNRRPSWRRRSRKGSPTPSSLPPTPTGPNRLMISCNTTGGMSS